MNILDYLKTCFSKCTAAFLTLCVTLGLCSPYVKDTNISTEALIVREAMRTVIHTFDPNGGGELFVKLGNLGINLPSTYNCPDEYEHNVYELENAKIEIIAPKEGENKNKVVYVLHGGGYVFGLADMYRNNADIMIQGCKGCTVALLDYRTAPDYLFPCQIEDAVDGWEWLLAQGFKPEDIIVTGDSAGGNLLFELLLELRDNGKQLPAAAIAMSPWGDLSSSGESYLDNFHCDPMFGVRENKGIECDVTAMGRAYAGDHDLKDPKVSPVFADFHDFCPTLIQVGTYEVLQSDSETIYNNMIDNGVDATLTEYEGMWHVFQMFDTLPESQVAWNEFCTYANAHFYG